MTYDLSLLRSIQARPDSRNESCDRSRSGAAGETFFRLWEFRTATRQRERNGPDANWDGVRQACRQRGKFPHSGWTHTATDSNKQHVGTDLEAPVVGLLLRGGGTKGGEKKRTSETFSLQLRRETHEDPAVGALMFTPGETVAS